MQSEEQTLFDLELRQVKSYFVFVFSQAALLFVLNVASNKHMFTWVNLITTVRETLLFTLTLQRCTLPALARYIMSKTEFHVDLRFFIRFFVRIFSSLEFLVVSLHNQPLFKILLQFIQFINRTES